MNQVKEWHELKNRGTPLNKGWKNIGVNKKTLDEYN